MIIYRTYALINYTNNVIRKIKKKQAIARNAALKCPEYADGVMKLDKFYVASIVKYCSIIALIQNFFSDMWGNNNKDTKLDHAKLRLLLKERGFLPGAESQTHQIDSHNGSVAELRLPLALRCAQSPQRGGHKVPLQERKPLKSRSCSRWKLRVK